MARQDDDPAEATKARHEVMELVRGNSVLSHLVLRLRESGLSWREVRAAVHAISNAGCSTSNAARVGFGFSINHRSLISGDKQPR